MFFFKYYIFSYDINLLITFNQTFSTIILKNGAQILATTITLLCLAVWTIREGTAGLLRICLESTLTNLALKQATINRSQDIQ